MSQGKELWQRWGWSREVEGGMTKQLLIVGGGFRINLLLHILLSAADFCVIILVLSDFISTH